ncbi:putative zinc finger protein VAR3, chloroplastic-like [Capsicum annuum]|nr:putative zinc finger protein VAR3, chloroplastic-like [Capsicum annuum]KAF3670703.1 putative zinc finger protein VAR3, chloroplastic-like [Capsicum annuum]
MRRQELEFEVGDLLYLKIFPIKGVKRFVKKGKISPHYVIAYRMLSNLWKVSYNLEFPAELASVHPVFYVSLLNKCIGGPASVIPLESLGVEDSISLEEFLIEILDHQIHRLRNKEIALAWAFEAIPPLRKKVMDYLDEVSYPRMFRWLAAKNNPKIKEADLFNPPDDAVMHPWIMPTEQELVMTSFITLGHVDTIADPMVDLIKKELAGATAIERVVRQGQPNVEALHDQPTKADPKASFGRVSGVGSRLADTATTHDDEHVDAQ